MSTLLESGCVGQFFNYAITFMITEQKSVQVLEMLRFALYSDGADLWVKSQVALGKIKGRGGSVQLRVGLGWLVSLWETLRIGRASGRVVCLVWCINARVDDFIYTSITLLYTLRFSKIGKFLRTQHKSRITVYNGFLLGSISLSGTGRGCIDFSSGYLGCTEIHKARFLIQFKVETTLEYSTKSRS